MAVVSSSRTGCKEQNSSGLVSAFIATAFSRDTAEAASTQWRAVADQIRSKVPKRATTMDDAEHDVQAYIGLRPFLPQTVRRTLCRCADGRELPREHRAKRHATNPIARLSGEIKRRTDDVGILPNDDAIVRLVGALLLEQNDDWAVQRARYMTPETIAPMGDDPIISLPAVAS